MKSLSSGERELKYYFSKMGVYKSMSLSSGERELKSYKYAGKKGIGAGLGNIQKVKDGESLAGTRTAQQDFKPVASAEDEDFM